MIREGSRYDYIGSEEEGLRMGDVCRVLSSDPTTAQVVWKTGARKGAISLVYGEDLVPHVARSAPVDDSLEAPLIQAQVRQVVAVRGIPGLLDVLVAEGHLIGLGAAAEEAIALLASKLRADPSIKEALGQLDADEGEALIYRGTRMLLQSAFGG